MERITYLGQKATKLKHDYARSNLMNIDRIENESQKCWENCHLFDPCDLWPSGVKIYLRTDLSVPSFTTIMKWEEDEK